jgi:Fe-S-cluster containining protein
MSSPSRLVNFDAELIQIVDNALLVAAHKSGEWLACKSGCHQCCVGVFTINQLDAARLRRGRDELDAIDPERAANLGQRVTAAVERLALEFPGDRVTGILSETAEAEAAFESFANEEPCPVLDPSTGTCDLYAARPMTCRVFGPPVRSEGGLGVCELCYHGATEEQIASCEMVPDPDGLEAILLERYERKIGTKGNTIVAFALKS